MDSQQDIKLVVIFMLVLTAVSLDIDWLKWMIIMVIFLYHLVVLIKQVKESLKLFPLQGDFLISRETDIYLLTYNKLAIVATILTGAAIMMEFSQSFLMIGIPIILILSVSSFVIETLIRKRSDIWKWDEMNRK
ncbi:hypothetical protein [Macrococcus brunensis]|uniref:hypothetical protein n=1 Tax=Macrococcus brunensis TaxID=198483 RepID=UPI001EF04B14|nr:hypothetical protein [Macrococcus brunensis]ULG74561.1 hypothetical protein MGG13_01970 [Macrococcus brunensis]